MFGGVNIKGVLWFGALILVTWARGQSQGIHQCRLEGQPKAVHPITIVLTEKTHVLRFAAEELQSILQRVTGKRIPVADKPASEGVSLILGDTVFSRQAGLKLSDLPREGYFIRRQGNSVYLVGRDSPTAPVKGTFVYDKQFERGTLSATYDFLERFAGVRFFFPGEMGTVVPQTGKLELPALIDIKEGPDFCNRQYVVEGSTGKWYEKSRRYDGVNGGLLNRLRLRMGEVNIPFTHGLSLLDLDRRIKDHPEYFAQKTDGTRYSSGPFGPQLCFNSGVRDIIYEDIKAFLTGKPASARGIRRWRTWCAKKNFISVMPQDGFYMCDCATCRPIARGGRHYKTWTAEENQRMSNLIWGFTADMASRLKRDKIPGYVTQMAYTAYIRVPECDLPDNVLVEIACAGPWVKDHRLNDRQLRAWCKKLKRPINVWTYPGKHSEKAVLTGIPSVTPRAIGTYYQERKDLISGTFMESETDEFIFHYLNWYMLAKISWNTSTDVEALLEDHYRAMFGAGAPMMRRFYDRLERLWIDRVVGNVVETNLGPVSILPSEIDLWTRIYSQTELEQMATWFKEAEQAASDSPDALKRLAFMREQFLGSLQRRLRNFQNDQQTLDEWRVGIPGRIGLRPLHGDENEVSTVVRVNEDKDNLIFRYTCWEPEMKRLRMRSKIRDEVDIWRDSVVELFLNPSGDRKNYLHLIVNAGGNLYDAKCCRHEPADLSWESHAKINIIHKKDLWKAEIRLPKASLGSYDATCFPVNFTRHRGLEGKAPTVIDYQWSPIAGRGFHAVEEYGMLQLKAKPDENLVKDSDFSCLRQNVNTFSSWRSWFTGKRDGGQSANLDRLVFLTAEKSLRLHNIPNEVIGIGQQLPMLKSNTSYHLSFFIRTKNLEPLGRGGAAARLILDDKHQWTFPKIPITGTQPWTRLSFNFKTGDLSEAQKPSLSFRIWNCPGDAWFDHVILKEVK